ncbi:MAG: alanyl-tRNA editing protein [Flavobacteriales bacterium]
MTGLDYLDDPYLLEGRATVKEFQDHEKGKALILDRTIFHPQGGGQPADRGWIEGDKGTLEVQDVRMNEDGEVLHFISTDDKGFQEGETVILKLDADGRKFHARLHTAGHLLDHAVQEAGIEGLEPGKGFHFPDGPYVEYEGNLEDAKEWASTVERIANELVDEDLPVEAYELSPEEAAERGVSAPEGKPARVVRIGEFPPIGCGGTHVKRTSEIGRIRVRKMKSKKGKTKVGYEVEAV